MAKPKTFKYKKKYNKRFTNKRFTNKRKNNKVRHTKKIYKKKRHTTLKHKNIQRGGNLTGLDLVSELLNAMDDDDDEKTLELLESALNPFKKKYNTVKLYLTVYEKKQISNLIDIYFRLYLQYQYNPVSNSKPPAPDITQWLLRNSLNNLDIRKLKIVDQILTGAQAELVAGTRAGNIEGQ